MQLVSISIPLLLIVICQSLVCVDTFQVSTPPIVSFRAAFVRSIPTWSSSPSFSLSATSRNNNGGGRRQMPVKEVRPPMNEEISAPVLRVTTPNPKGKDDLLGIMSRDEALAKAKELGGLDLILVNNNSDPPVCKIVDFSKYRYAQEKKAKEVKKNSKTSELKEVKMSYKIDVHDYDVRKKSAYKFLRQGNRVKCSVMFRGREVQHDNLGFELLERLAVELDATSIKENKPRREGKIMSLILAPRPEVMKALNEERRKMDKLKKQKRIERLQNPSLADDDDDDEEDDDDDEVNDDDTGMNEDYGEDDDDDEEVPAAPAAAATKPTTKSRATLEKMLTEDYF